MSYHGRIVKRLREVQRRRGFLSPAQRAILEFHQVLEAGESPSRSLMPKVGTRSDEDESTCEACGSEDERGKFCSECGEKMRAARADETEGRTGREPDVNDLGAPRYHGEDHPDIVVRSGKAAEAVKTFKSAYRKARESTHTGFQGLPKGF